MLQFVLVFQVLTFLVLSALFVLIYWEISTLRRKGGRALKRIVERVEKIVESQRLSTVLKFEPKSLGVDPERFEPKKAEVRTRLLTVFEKETHPNPGTWAYCVLDHSGWNEFVSGETFLAAKNALARLRVNNDTDGARQFLEELVDKL